MVDQRLISELTRNLNEAREKAQTHFRGITNDQLNWKSAPESWSIGQCLDHLVTSDSLYFPALKKITEGNLNMSFWQKWSPFSAFLGRMLVSQTKEQPVKRMNAPKVFIPSYAKIDEGIWDRFYKHLDTLTEYVSLSANVDLDKIKISSPVSSFITYSLRNAYIILVQHEHRHINQAIRVKEKMLRAASQG